MWLLTDDVPNFLLRLLTELFESRRQIALQIPVERFGCNGEQHTVIVVVAKRTLDDAAKLRVHPLVVCRGQSTHKQCNDEHSFGFDNNHVRCVADTCIVLRH